MRMLPILDREQWTALVCLLGAFVLGLIVGIAL